MVGLRWSSCSVAKAWSPPLLTARLADCCPPVCLSVCRSVGWPLLRLLFPPLSDRSLAATPISSIPSHSIPLTARFSLPIASTGAPPLRSAPSVGSLPLRPFHPRARRSVCCSCGAGDLASVEDLLAQGEDVNCRGAQNRTPLHRAVGKGHNAVVQQLIRQGADLSLLDQGGLTPLSETHHTQTTTARQIQRGSTTRQTRRERGATRRVAHCASARSAVVCVSVLGQSLGRPFRSEGDC